MCPCGVAWIMACSRILLPPAKLGSLGRRAFLERNCLVPFLARWLFATNRRSRRRRPRLSVRLTLILLLLLLLLLMIVIIVILVILVILIVAIVVILITLLIARRSLGCPGRSFVSPTGRPGFPESPLYIYIYIYI